MAIRLDRRRNAGEEMNNPIASKAKEFESKRLFSLESIVGKTATYAKYILGKAVLRFGDDSWIMLECEHGYDCEVEFSVSSEEIGLHDARNFSFITEEECDAYCKWKNDFDAKQAKQAEYQQYLKMKERYEGGKNE